MLSAILAMIFGILLLMISADRFVMGAGSLAQSLKMPSMIIGIIIIGFGTSAPEWLVSAMSAYQGNPDIALGNAYGSNIGNIGLILGMSILLKPMFINVNLLKRELPLLWIIFGISIYIGFELLSLNWLLLWLLFLRGKMIFGTFQWIFWWRYCLHWWCYQSVVKPISIV